MSRTARQYRDLDLLLRDYAARRAAIERRLQEFAAVPPADYLFELVYCLLTPQSSAVNAGSAVDVLRTTGLTDHGLVAATLQRKEAYIRFHNTKARHVVEAAIRFPEIAIRLRNGGPARDVRSWLVMHVKGLGWKEASHFLRNIGYRDLAILDRHILRNLQRHGVLRRLPPTLTRGRYLAIEERFARFARDLGISMDALDLLFWSRETGQILK